MRRSRLWFRRTSLEPQHFAEVLDPRRWIFGAHGVRHPARHLGFFGRNAAALHFHVSVFFARRLFTCRGGCQAKQEQRHYFLDRRHTVTLLG